MHGARLFESAAAAELLAHLAAGRHDHVEHDGYHTDNFVDGDCQVFQTRLPEIWLPRSGSAARSRRRVAAVLLWRRDAGPPDPSGTLREVVRAHSLCSVNEMKRELQRLQGPVAERIGRLKKQIVRPLPKTVRRTSDGDLRTVRLPRVFCLQSHSAVHRNLGYLRHLLPGTADGPAVEVPGPVSRSCPVAVTQHQREVIARSLEEVSASLRRGFGHLLPL